MTAKTKAPPLVELEPIAGPAEKLAAADAEISQRVKDICANGSGSPHYRARLAADALALHFGSLRTTWLIEDAEKAGQP